MIANFTPNKVYTISERFLAEKLLELFFNRTLDSHRAKLHNPKWILIELHQVLSDWAQGKIKAFDKTIRPVILETLKFLEVESLLQFDSINIKFFKTLLGNATEKNYQHLSYTTRVILEKNMNYQQKLLDKIEEEIAKLNLEKVFVEKLESLNIYVDYLATELINQGYAKGYLYSIISRIFSDKRNLDFVDAFKEFKSAILREEEEFKIIFRINKLAGNNEKIDIKSSFEIDEKFIEEISNINDKSKQFFSNQNGYAYFLAFTEVGHDYLSVIEKAKKKLFTLIDLIHMGYPNYPFGFAKKCLVIGTRKPELTNIQPVFYIPDGSYKNNEELYETLLQKMSRMNANSKIQKESIQKIVSAFRHLRLGRDADELEQKFLNYWIGLEYIFSNYDVHDTTIIRLKEYFIHSHSIAYIKRNLFEFHNDIKRFKLLTAIPDASENLNYLKNSQVYDFIIDNFSESFPLLAFRANKYKDLLNRPGEIKNEILKHRTNLEWHLTRCYRIRNEIVHDAAIHLNIESITSNLRYYLVYILNSLLDYLDSLTTETYEDQISINDYFLLQEITYSSLSMSSFPLNDLMSVKSATEIFS